MKKLVALFFVLAVLFSTPAFGVRYIRDIETDPSEVEPGDSFTIIAGLRSTSWAKTVKFYLDGQCFDSRNTAGDDEKVESTKWDMDDRPLECGTHELTVELLTRRGQVMENDTLEIDIGNVPDIAFKPTNPDPNKPLIIKFTDKKSGEPIKNADVKITKLRDIEGVHFRGETNAAGEALFTIDKRGEYKLEMSSKRYCITHNFWVKRSMLIDGPHPTTPVIGSLISFAVPPGVGVKIADVSGNIIKTASTSINGGVNFTMDKAGNYTVLIGDISTEYWGMNVSLIVYDKLTPLIDIKPEEVVVNRPVDIQISVEGELMKPISGIEVKASKPSGEHSVYITDEAGVVTFTPLFVGEYILRVEREDLRTVTKSLKALNLLNAGIVTEDIMVDRDIELIVKDQGNILVDKASVSVEGTGVSGLTNINGKFSFTLPRPGRYTLSVTRNDSWGVEENFSVSGYLYMNLSRDEIELDEHVDISVSGIDDREVDAELWVVKPDKTREKIPGGTYTPRDVGLYKITASRDMYQDVSKTLTVNPHGIYITTNVSDNILYIKVVSRGEPVGGVGILLEIGDKTKNLVTDKRGVAEYRIQREETVAINANLIDGIKEYGTTGTKVKIFKRYDYTLLIGVITVIILLAAASILLITIAHGRVDKSRKKKNSLEREKGRTRLSKV